MSVCPLGTTRFPPDGFSLNFVHAEDSNSADNATCFDVNQSHHLVQHCLNTSQKHLDRHIVQYNRAVSFTRYICQFRAFPFNILVYYTDRQKAAHQTHVDRHTCNTSDTRAMIQSLSQKPVIKITFLPYGGAIGPARCIIPKMEVPGDKSTLYIRVTLH